MIGRGFRARAVILAFFATVVFPPLSFPEEIVDIKTSSEEGRTLAVIETSGSVEFVQGRLKNPDRFYLDLKGVGIGAQRELEGTGLVAKVRLGRFDAETARIVFDLAGEANVRIQQMSNPSRLVIEFSGSPAVRVAAPVAALSKKAAPAGFAPKTRIVIDAGHGGHDPGAIGPGGLKEKDVTLAIALELARLMGKDPRYEVKLTRDRDVYLTLEERTLIANRFGADLFISVHINASPRSDARGIETYFLNWSDDEEANRVAARENAISIRRLKEARTELGFILASLELQEKRDDSLKLAHHIQKSVVSSVGEENPDVPDLGVKQALFYVLVGARMPSILTEISFISNKKDEKLLRSRDYLRDVAGGIAAGIETYLKDLPSQDVAKR